MRHAVLALSLLATPAVAGVEEAITDHALSATDRFAEAAGALAETAGNDCTAEALRPAWNDAFDAWLGLAHLRFGPLETGSRALSIAFWPDPRGMIPRTVSGIVADADPIVETPEGFAEVSIAARGLFAMERLLYAEDLSAYAAGDYACTLAWAQAQDLARMGNAIAEDWEAFAETIRTAGEAGNDTFLSEREPRQAFYTALTTGMSFVIDQRLGRPLGSFDDPRPDRAEARLSGRALRNVTLSVEALRDLARALAPGEIPQTDAAFARALTTAGRIDAGDFSGVSDPRQRIVVEALQQQLVEARENAANEIGVPLGVSAGFNASDGD
ncbi:imelysin family protein [Roseivivax sediminis]|uniref:Imelysin-like domain-containing protein n=1 Tax=Roseivivax sediminis TaxID=936889 RepID=A0A1I1ZCZ1_9RHOB|nr:imelysin family protein [Roseivivax sediminis]SFE29577.1 hypothetical protein SAMN04515678_10896 [Roseivivax sediminis]